MIARQLKRQMKLVILIKANKRTARCFCSPEESQPILNTFRNLVRVDEIEVLKVAVAEPSPPALLSKSQRKKQKKALGKGSPQLS